MNFYGYSYSFRGFRIAPRLSLKGTVLFDALQDILRVCGRFISRRRNIPDNTPTGIGMPCVTACVSVG